MSPMDWERIGDQRQDGKIVIGEACKVSTPEGLSVDFKVTLSKVIKDYEETLKGLKDR
ncbi:hypothetical protein NLX71_22735 [Paenibacillus sp. MZ04-78.2]|uniref:hypothetical protein n=1 Tax=Paenibacillus sp. MZ04-78.2 TaxID=2962034 RepID=UPI0020B8F323|nr:hypothetical protein [Paenibacillus sp. MZ04-78.2]MCP3776083.1 hypothetical protein [Paenibacillus sp. MZ04-78.2]